MDTLRQKVAALPPGVPAAELETAIEELSIAEESLQQQADALSRALERSEANHRRYLELFEFAPDAYCVTDQSGVVLEANQAMCTLLLRSTQGVIGKPLFVFVEEPDRRHLRDFISSIDRTQQRTSDDSTTAWQTELSVQKNGPVPVWVRCTVRKHEGITNLLWLFRDISQQKRMQEEAQQYQDRLEEAVHEKTKELQERVQELETFHDVVVNRELRMIELEKEVEALKRRDASTETE